MQATSCSGCGAPLGDPGAGEVIVCAYCHRTHHARRTAPRRGKSVYRSGQAVLVKWGTTWWDATILDVVGPRAWRIRYDGYSSQWDEVVGPGRVRPLDESESDADYDDAWDAEEAPSAPVPSAVSAPPDLFGPGRPVDVLWNGTWYAATIKRVIGPSAWEIHYLGYAASWDETVGPDRIRARTASATRGGARGLWIALAAVGLVCVLGAGAFALMADRAGLAGSAMDPGGAVPAPGSLVAGRRVHVIWNGAWYDATVITPLPDGSAHIHYEGWSARYDETVTPDRIRVTP